MDNNEYGHGVETALPSSMAYPVFDLIVDLLWGAGEIFFARKEEAEKGDPAFDSESNRRPRTEQEFQAAVRKKADPDRFA
jgi:hypothetical protein